MTSPPLHFSPKHYRVRDWALNLAMLVSLLATFGHAQNSQFLFDPNGNLTVQMADTLFPPQITGQPQNQIVATNESAAFSVVVADPRSLTYQWRFNSTNISGENGVSLLLENVTANNEGPYQVVLTNPSGSITSAPAMLWIDNDGDGLGDSWELTHFGNLNQNATTDFDHDGLSNLREFLDGTDPTDPNSALFRLVIVREGGSVVKFPDQPSYNKGELVTLTVTASSNELFHAWLGDVVSRDNPVSLVMTNDKTVYARFTPIVFTWTNLASGDWETATNWTPNLAPGLNDIANINSSVTVTLNTDADCADVTLGGSGPTLTGNGTLTVRDNLLWTAGTMSGSGRTILETNSILNLPAGVSLNTRTLENGGTILWGGGGFFSVTGGAVITNRAGAVFRAENLSAASLGGGIAAGRIDNAGVFRKVAGTGPVTIERGLNLNNSGTVEIEADTLLCNGGFTNNGAVILSPGTTNRLLAGGSASGTFTAPATAMVEWTGGIFTLNAGAQLNGAGLYRISPGTVTANANTAVENMDLINGTLDGTGTVTINNAMNWTAGTMGGSGRTIISPGATLTIANPSAVLLSARTLENGGTALWTGAGNIGLLSGIITNRAGALFLVQNAAVINFVSGACRIDNAGTFRKSANAGTTTIASGVGFNNSGTVEIQTGTLLCNGSFTNNGAVNLSAGATNRLAGGESANGSFTAPATALAEWTSGTFTLNTGAQLNGAGLYKINGGRVTANANVMVENLDLINGALDGTSTVTVANAMNWPSGSMGGSGRTIIAATALLTIANPSSVLLTTRTLENGGTVLWTGAGNIGLLGGIITNRSGALFLVQNAAILASVGGGPRFDNAGSFRKSANTGTTILLSIPFNNYGTVDIRSGILSAIGGYVSSSGALLNVALGGTTAGASYGQLQVAGAVTLNGALSVDLTNGFSPALNDSFTVVSGTHNGTFVNFFYPSNSVSMQLSNAASAVTIRVSGITAPELVLLPALLTRSNVTLCWITAPNKIYRLEYTPDPGQTNWDAVPGEIITSSNQACVIDALTSSNRFYRVRVVP